MADILGWDLPSGFDVSHHKLDAGWRCDWSSILEGTNVLEKLRRSSTVRLGLVLRTLSPKPHMRARMGCCSTRRLPAR